MRRQRKAHRDLARSETPCMRGRTARGNREVDAARGDERRRPHREVLVRSSRFLRAVARPIPVLGAGRLG